MKVKKQIGKQIMTSFFVVLMVTFILTTLLYTLVSRRFVIGAAETDMKDSIAIITRSYDTFLSNIEDFENKEDFPNDDKSNNREKLILRRLINGSQVVKGIENLDKLKGTETLITQADNVYLSETWDAKRLEEVKNTGQSDGIKYIYYEHTLPENELFLDSIVILKTYEDVDRLRNIGVRAFIISFAIGGLLTVILGAAISRKISKPIRLLSDSMVAYTDNKQPVTVYKSDDEIEFLAHNFQDMTQKMSKLDERQKQFFQNSSHELKTPLMSIQGYAEAIKDGIVTGDDLDQSLNVIIAESQRLKNIVDDVIYLSKIDNMEDEVIKQDNNLYDLIMEATEVVRPLLTVNNIELEIGCDENLMTYFDYDKMKRVIINLVGNASRYAKSKVVVSANQANGKTYIDVIDDGQGFEIGQEDKVFDRFHKGKQGGSGIGLSLTKEIIEKHGGSIKAVNNMNYGAIFKIEI